MGTKLYYTLSPIGKAKYVLNYHDGERTHEDGSPFFDVLLFSNKRKLNQAVNRLKRDGYKEL